MKGASDAWRHSFKKCCDKRKTRLSLSECACDGRRDNAKCKQRYQREIRKIACVNESIAIHTDAHTLDHFNDLTRTAKAREPFGFAFIGVFCHRKVRARLR